MQYENPIGRVELIDMLDSIGLVEFSVLEYLTR